MSVSVNTVYWQAKRGMDYAAQQAMRRISAGIRSEYRVQERWVAAFVRGLGKRLKRTPDILEVGCGFGRFFPVVEQAGGRYYGYDFSASMAEPARRLDPSSERIRVAPVLSEAWPSDQFDALFTVSVFIHNDLAAARQLLAAMRERLRPGGVIVLTENLCVLEEFKSNLWHGGCWAHDFVQDIAPDMHICIRDNVLDGQSIYVLSESTAGARELNYSGKCMRGRFSPEDLSDIAAQNLKRLQMAHEQEVSLMDSALMARQHDLEEAFTALRTILARRGVSGALEMGPAEISLAIQSALHGERNGSGEGNS